jgi:hypothetical protein
MRGSMGRATVRLQIRYIGNDRRATTVTGRATRFPGMKLLRRDADDAIDTLVDRGLGVIELVREI